MPAKGFSRSSSPAEEILGAFGRGFEPEPLLSVSEWADRYRVLTSKSSAEVGPWRTSRTPYLKEILDCLSPKSPVRKVVVMKGTQLGLTEAALCWVGYIIHQMPRPVLFFRPTVESAKRLSTERLGPAIEAVPELRALVSEEKSRDSRNTMFIKEFRGGQITLAGTNSSVSLRSSSAPYLILDEVDEFPADLSGQGDAIGLITERAATYPGRKIFLNSTPTIKGFSKIEQEYLETDQRRYFVPCPKCGAMDWLKWKNIRWDDGRPETARLACEACGGEIEEREKTWMLSEGEWRATAPGSRDVAGFHLSGLYSPLGWKSWAECAEQFLKAKEDPTKLKRWVNTTLGESWEERGDAIEAQALSARLERYPAEVPHGVGILVNAVDVQGDRLEVQTVGFGAGEESWLIAHAQIMGDPSHEGPDEDGTPSVWQRLDEYSAQRYTHESGKEIRAVCMAIDSGGFDPEPVYKYVRPRQRKGIFAIKGSPLQGKELVSRPTDTNSYRVALYSICVDTGKELVYGRLRIPQTRVPGSPVPGYMHLPEWVDSEYLQQLTAEKAIRKYVKGRGSIKQWVKLRSRNEALDLTVYSVAALYIYALATGLKQNLVASLGNRAADLSKPPGAAAPNQPRVARVRVSSNWVMGWKHRW